MENKEPVVNAIFLGDLSLQSSKKDVSELVELAEKTLKKKSIKSYLLERTARIKRKEMSMFS